MKNDARPQLRRFGITLRRIRTDKGLTQEKLAEQADLHPRNVQKIETGETNLLVTTAARLQKALGCEWNDLMCFGQKPC